jgi:hypothetical protein
MKNDAFVYVLRWKNPEANTLTSLYQIQYTWEVNKLKSLETDLTLITRMIQDIKRNKFVLYKITTGFFHTFPSIKEVEDYVDYVRPCLYADKDSFTDESLWELKLYKALIPAKTLYLKGYIDIKEKFKVLLTRKLMLVEELKSFKEKELHS